MFASKLVLASCSSRFVIKLQRIARDGPASISHTFNRAASSANPTGGPKYLAQVIEDLKARGLKANGNFSAPNIFSLFKLEQALTINESNLKREYTKLQRSIHPDRFVNSDPITQNQVLQISSLVNDSYETLKHPYKRAKYLLSLKLGKSQDELDQSLDALKLDDEFLSRMMDLREQVELNRNMEQVMRLASEIEDELGQLMMSMRENFNKNEASNLLEQLGKLKFLANLHVKLADKTERFSTF